jgi:CrcB protein
MITPLLVALGGAGGCLARYGIGTAVSGPWPTVGINLLGSFLLGALTASSAFSADVRAALGVGVLGGFTTYSTFAVQIVLEADGGRPGRALAYVLVSVLGGVAWAAAGYALTR